MRRMFIPFFLTIILVSCNHNAVGNSIVVGSIREDTLLSSSKIYAMDEKGTMVPFSSPFSVANNASWSPDRQWVVYQTEDTAKDTDPDIFVIKSDSTQKIALTNDSYPCGFEPTWSPDGKKIASFFCGVNGQSGIHTVDVSCLIKGQDCEFDYQFITEGGGVPSWSPDGKQLAFWTSDHQIFVVSVETPEKIKRITPENIECFETAWSPVSDEIAIRCYVDNQGNNIFLVNSDGSNFRNITNSKSQDGLPTWSPDGTKIAFVSNRAEELGGAIIYPGISSNAVYIMNSDGSGVKRISPYNNERIVWIDWLNP